MTNKTPSAIDLVEQLHELSERYPANRWYREAADTITRLQAALKAIHEARLVDGKDRGYGWSITKLNRAMDAALPLIGRDAPPKPTLPVKALRSSVGGEAVDKPD